MITVEVGEHPADLLADQLDQGLGEGVEHDHLVPRLRAEAATSKPIQPAPTMTTFAPDGEALPKREGVVEPRSVKRPLRSAPGRSSRRG